MHERVTDRGAILRMFTLNYAKMVGEDQAIGSIEPGKSADFVLLSDNFMTAPLNNIRDMKAIETYIGGHKVYENK